MYKAIILYPYAYFQIKINDLNARNNKNFQENLRFLE